MRPVILWDIDGTLVDSEKLHEIALKTALREVNIEPPADFQERVIGIDMAETHHWCVQHLGLTLTLDDLEWRTYRAYLAQINDLLPREGAVELFLHLRKDGYQQAVVSNSDRIVVNANLDAAGPNASRLISISRNDVHKGKPDPEPYRRAASLLQAGPDECLVIEDSTTGAKAGLAAGMRTLFWPQSKLPTPDGAVTVSSFSHLIDLIEGKE